VDASGLLIFAGALTVAAGSPGPSVATLVARVIARGWRDVIPFAAAMWLGEALWLTLAVYGLAALAEALHGAFQVVKYLGVAYLLYLAGKMWFAPVAVASDGPAPRPGGCGMFLAGLAVTLGNRRSCCPTWHCCRPSSILLASRWWRGSSSPARCSRSWP
jgi:threonine/homoserine/homoserine lactone efflux protein